MEKSDNQQEKNGFSKALAVAAYPIAAISGWWAGTNKLSTAAYITARSDGGFDDIDRTFKPDRVALTHDRIAGRNTGVGAYIEPIMESRAAHSAAVAERMKTLELGTFSKQWRYVNRENKQNALMAGMRVSGIAIGALLVIANSKVLGNMFSHDSDSQER